MNVCWPTPGAKRSAHMPRFASVILFMTMMLSGATFGMAQMPVVTLHDMMIGPEGTHAACKVSLAAYIDVEMPTELGAFLPGQYEDIELQAMVQYTVLAQDKFTKQPRLAVRAYGLDPETELPLRGHGPWDLIYGIRAGQVVYVGGDALESVPDDYLLLIEPSWLVDWPLTRQNDRSSTPLVVGREWASVAGLPHYDMLNIRAQLPMTGVLAEWVHGGELGPVAHIVEYAEGTDVLPNNVLGMLGTVENAHLTLEQHYWAIPGQFPLVVEQYGAGNARLSLGSLASLAAEFSHISLDSAFSLTYDRDLDGAFDALIDNETPSSILEFGTRVNGRLTPGGYVLDDGSYTDLYTFNGNKGDRIVVTLESDDFDAYLILMDDDGYMIDYDDDSAGFLNARIRAVLPWDGTYELWATSWDSGEQGRYTLSLDLLPPFDIDSALASLAALRDPDALNLDELQQLEWLLDELMDIVLELQDHAWNAVWDSMYDDNFQWEDFDWDDFNWDDFDWEDFLWDDIDL